ncbi:MAG TPA: MBL fold metallo-hydrolase [Bryobacterales bacterium]|nr:MBL fold metallo-hydrolase [Bryobacterales bacterium]
MSFTGPLQITVLGSGTSVGVPTIGCDCRVCRSTDPHDKRLRPSVLVTFNGHHVLIDTTPDFRAQALRAGLRALDAVLYTHAHADHILGLDDLRPFNYGRPEPIPIYARPDALETIKRVFRYVFEETNHCGGIPRLTALPLGDSGVEIGGLHFRPVPILHGARTIVGFRFGRAAYLTDQSDIPEASLDLLQDLDVLFLDALRHTPHPTHSTIERSLGWVERLRPARAFFTHICHELSHEETNRALPPHVRLAYDNLEIEVPGDA